MAVDVPEFVDLLDCVDVAVAVRERVAVFDCVEVALDVRERVEVAERVGFFVDVTVEDDVFVAERVCVDVAELVVVRDAVVVKDFDVDLLDPNEDVCDAVNWVTFCVPPMTTPAEVTIVRA